MFRKGENRSVDVTSFIRAEARQDEDDWDALRALKRVSLAATDKLDRVRADGQALSEKVTQMLHRQQVNTEKRTGTEALLSNTTPLRIVTRASLGLPGQIDWGRSPCRGAQARRSVLCGRVLPCSGSPRDRNSGGERHVVVVHDRVGL